MNSVHGFPPIWSCWLRCLALMSLNLETLVGFIMEVWLISFGQLLGFVRSGGWLAFKWGWVCLVCNYHFVKSLHTKVI